MGTDTSTTSIVVLEVVNSVTQTSVSSCEVSCNQDQSGNTVIISPGANTGNISFTQACVINDASCTINTNLESEIENILESTLEQTAAATKSVIGLTYNSTKCVNKMEQVIGNQVQQLISNTCTIESNQTMNSNYLYVGQGSEVGNISFAQTSTLSNVDCTMDNSGKSTSYNEETSEVEQKATTINMAVMIVLIFSIVIMLGMVLIAIFLLSGKTEDIIGSASQAAQDNPELTAAATKSYIG